MNPLLSICIPTYNRSVLLKQLLASIHENLLNLDNVEVIVSDNNSTDNTHEIVDLFQHKMQIQYNRNSSNHGAVKNLFMATRFAKGKYLWLFSDDDLMTKGSIDYLVKFLRLNDSNAYVYFPRILVDINLEPTSIGKQPPISTGDILFKSGIELYSYMNGEMPSIMGFFSSTIVKNDLWKKHIDNSYDYFESEWAHLKTILKAIPDKECAILGKAGVLCRLGNYRSFNMNSKVWFDDYVDVFKLAISLGYSPELSKEAIERVIVNYSKSVVIDKAKGLREDSVHSILVRYNILDVKIKYFPWYILSYLPNRLLKMLLYIYDLFSH